MWDHKDFLIFFAAGNAGPGTGTVGSPSTAKNGVSVGATLRGTSADSMASLQQLRPDRRRPHQARHHGAGLEHRLGRQRQQHHHQQLRHPRRMSGTSMATPGRRGPDGPDPPVLHRRLVSHGRARLGATASRPRRPCSRRRWSTRPSDMTGTTAIPANCQGWGRVLLDNALFFTGQARKLWVKDDATAFATGSANEDRDLHLHGRRAASRSRSPWPGPTSPRPRRRAPTSTTTST